MDPIDLATGFSVCILDDALLSVSAVATSWKIIKLGVCNGEINTDDPVPHSRAGVQVLCQRPGSPNLGTCTCHTVRWPQVYIIEDDSIH